jgi:hypothetical protein
MRQTLDYIHDLEHKRLLRDYHKTHPPLLEMLNEPWNTDLSILDNIILGED